MPLLLTNQDVNSLLNMDDAIVAVEEVIKQQASGEASNRPRGHDTASPGSYLATMQAALYSQGVFGFKTYTASSGVFRFLVYLHDMTSGQLLCVAEANRMGQLRTGAATGVATKHMSRSESSVVGIIGSGYQAGSQLEAICKVRPIESAKVYSPNREHRNAFARDMSNELGIEATAVETPRGAVEGVDILTTITASRTPVFDGEWLEAGTHINAVGGANEYVTELDDATIQRADSIVVDDIAQAKIECGELMMPASRGLILWEQLHELWEIIGGVIPGRANSQDITLFKSLGMAMWDVAVANVVYDKAVAQGVGVRI